MTSLSEKILQLQGDGNYQGVGELVQRLGVISPQLQSDLDKLSDAGIPVDVKFNQGKAELGLWLSVIFSVRHAAHAINFAYRPNPVLESARFSG